MNNLKTQTTNNIEQRKEQHKQLKHANSTTEEPIQPGTPHNLKTQNTENLQNRPENSQQPDLNKLINAPKNKQPKNFDNLKPETPQNKLKTQTTWNPKQSNKSENLNRLNDWNPKQPADTDEQKQLTKLELQTTWNPKQPEMLKTPNNKTPSSQPKQRMICFLL